MLDVIRSLIASPVWHVLYPFKEGECCYVADETAWETIGKTSHWSKDYDALTTHIQCLFWEMGLDVYASDCPLKPYRFHDSKVLLIPAEAAVCKLANRLNKVIVIHRLVALSPESSSYRELYRVGERAL